MKRKQKAPKLEQWKRPIVLTSVFLAITLAIVVSWILKEKPKAVIIDQLGQTYPNPTLIKSISGTFSQAGFKVDYIPSEEVTVNFYRGLPKRGYKYIILRAHSCLFRDDPIPRFREELTFSTNELYTSLKYVDEQRNSEIAWLNLNSPADETKYFGVSSRFVESSMEGRFNNATVIIMGCNGLTFPHMAEALRRKGVRSVIGWDKTVSLKHTDSAVELLMENLLNRQMEVKEAVENVMVKIGEDPEYRSRLLVYQ